MELGVAFQIVDDVLDLYGHGLQIGKPAGSDLRGGVFTLPVLMTLQRDPALVELLVEGIDEQGIAEVAPPRARSRRRPARDGAARSTICRWRSRTSATRRSCPKACSCCGRSASSCSSRSTGSASAPIRAVRAARPAEVSAA